MQHIPYSCPSEPTPNGNWDATSSKQGQEIYTDYAECFSATFPAVVSAILISNSLDVNHFSVGCCENVTDVCPQCTQVAAADGAISGTG